jgi:hypothetical protein
MDEMKFRRLVWRMRQAQKRYFESVTHGSAIGKREALALSIQLEKQVDKVLGDMTEEAQQLKVWQ